MADESMPTMNSNLISNDETTSSSTVSSKDEPTTFMVHENGYESECSSSSRSIEDITRSTLEIEADTFTRFIERQRVEVMFELRHLRLGERPVTGQANREQIQTFLDHIHDQQRSNIRTLSTRPIVPSAHIDDIDALANRRCVSAALASVAFRRDLENAVRRSIETQRVAPPPPPPPRRIPVATQSRIPEAPPIPRTLASINTEQQQQQQQQQQNLPSRPLIPIIPTVTRQQENDRRTEIETHEPFNIERQERELEAWRTITQLQREIIVLEISDLVHRQLVTSALESDFRAHLEQNILQRLTQGAPPEQNQQQQQQAPPVPRGVRVLPTPAPVRENTTNQNSALNVDEISTRLDTMYHMLQLMFSMQMEMQRTLRQEVANAITNNASNTMILSSQSVNAGRCTICLTAIADTVLYRCGHLCVCYLCGLNLREGTSTTVIKCPICRAPVDDILRVYQSSQDQE